MAATELKTGPQSWIRLTLFGLLVAGFVPVAAQGGPLTLKLWEHEREEDQKILDEVIERFASTRSDIRVLRSHYKTEDLRSQFQTAALAGGGADIVIAPNDFAGAFSIMKVIQPPKLSPEQWTRFFPQVVQAVRDREGQAWGIPISYGNHLMLFSNRRLIGDAPKTIDELVAKARTTRIPRLKPNGLAFHLNEPFWFVPFLAGFGEKPLVDGKPNLGGAGMVKALELVRSLKFDSKIVPSDCDYACADTLFVERKVAMLINGDWAIKKYQRELGADLIISALPRIGSTPMAPMVSGKYVFLHHKLEGDKLNAAMAFAEFLTTPETQEWLVKRSRRLPALKRFDLNDPLWKDLPELKSSMQALEHGQPMPMDVEMRIVWDAIRPQLQGVMAGRIPAQKAAPAMQQDAERRMVELGH